MVSVEKAVIARLKQQNENFEILVDCDKALEFREGKASLEDALATLTVFKDVKKGLHASESEMLRIFGTKDAKGVAETIIKKGDIQLTQEHRNRLREEKKRKIISIIHKNAINTQTNAPHPPDRIERAMHEAKVNIDEFKKAEEQVPEVLHKIKAILPIRFEIMEVSIKIPANYAGKSYTLLKDYGKILKDEWQSDGSLLAIVEIPGGVSEEFEDELNGLTHGNIQIEVIKRS